MPLAMLVATAIVLASCSSSESSSTATADTVAATTAAPSDTTAQATEATEPVAVDQEEDPEPSEDAGAQAEMSFVTSDGGSWQLQQEECLYDPDQEGPFATLWAVSGSTDSGAELGFFESVPADGEGTVVIGTFVDEGADIVYVVIEATAVADDSTLTVSVGMHDNPLRAVGDPIDLTATLTCSL